MAKRTIKPSKQKPEVEKPADQNGEAERPAEVVSLPEQPVSAADLLDAPPIMPILETVWVSPTKPDAPHAEPEPPEPQIPATLAEPDPPAEPTHLQENPDDPAVLELRARNEWHRKLDNAKDEHLAASLAVEQIKGELKAAKKRQENALELYQEIETRGPVIPQPVTPPEEQSGTQQPLPEKDNCNWRSVPITDLDLASIKGLGAEKKGKKYQALIDAVPDLGAFEDLRAEAGIDGIHTKMPDGIGQTVADALEELHLNYVSKWRSAAGAHGINERVKGPPAKSDDTGAEMVETPCSTHAETHSAPAPDLSQSMDSANIPSFTEWELMTSEQQHDWINQRAAQISESSAVDILKINLTADFQAGGIAYGRGEPVTDCPRIPGDEMDQWLAGYFDAARGDDESELRWRGEEEEQPEPELATASVGGPETSTPVYSDLDDI